MRIIWQALAGALALHLAYIGIVFLIGWLQTYFYKPQFSPGTVVLQSEVVFGVVTAPPGSSRFIRKICMPSCNEYP